MKAKMIHRCIHVLDLDASLAFYERALGLAVQRRMGPDDGSWENVFLGNEKTDFQVELTWNRGRTEPYDNGGRDTHLAFEVDDMDAARALHEEMGCVCFVRSTSVRTPRVYPGVTLMSGSFKTARTAPGKSSATPASMPRER